MADRLVNMVYFTEEDFCGDYGSILFLGITGLLYKYKHILMTFCTVYPQIHHSVTLIHLKGSLSYGICVCVQKGASGVVTCAMVLSTQQNFSLPYWNTW